MVVFVFENITPAGGFTMDAMLRRTLAGLRWLLVGAAVAALFGGTVALGSAVDSPGHDRSVAAFASPDDVRGIIAAQLPQR
ncbi:hypothetical protein AB0C34_02135 [Nocardia sp. NPDC049220]|uniref:hypothetical protein n=1 Tax=Nocardia sp. NPDC049220 TaxID=3155273 RepID=UPI0033C23919